MVDKNGVPRTVYVNPDKRDKDTRYNGNFRLGLTHSVAKDPQEPSSQWGVPNALAKPLRTISEAINEIPNLDEGVEYDRIKEMQDAIRVSSGYEARIGDFTINGQDAEIVFPETRLSESQENVTKAINFKERLKEAALDLLDGKLPDFDSFADTDLEVPAAISDPQFLLNIKHPESNFTARVGVQRFPEGSDALILEDGTEYEGTSLRPVDESGQVLQEVVTREEMDALVFGAMAIRNVTHPDGKKADLLPQDLIHEVTKVARYARTVGNLQVDYG